MENNSVQGQVYSTLRNSILCLQLKPGTAVSTQGIATMLSVSRTPVREAFIRLQRDGLIDIYPQKETVISRINLKRIHQERFIRESLECANIDAIIHNGGPHDLSALYENLEEQKRILAQKNPDTFEFFKIDNKFHQLLFALSGQELGGQVIADTNTHYSRVRLVTLASIEITRTSIMEHELILSEVEKNLAELARGHMRNHLHHLENEIGAFVKEFPDYFETGEEQPPNYVDSFLTL